MLGKLLSTRRGNTTINLVLLVVGIILVIAIKDTRSGVILMLAVTTVESGLFTLIFGIRGRWQQSDAARAVFWFMLAYFGVAGHALTLYLWPQRYWWSDDLRELLYMGLAIAGANLLLTMMRVLGTQLYTREGDLR